jgi:hypothetical protein
MSIDTLREARKLEAAGFSPEQAVAIIEIQYRPPSLILGNLERAGFERAQALAILDYYWTVREASLMQHPRWRGLLGGAVVALTVLGAYFIFFMTAWSLGWLHLHQ